MGRSVPDKPEVFATEEHMVLVLDGRGPRDAEDKHRYLRDEPPLKGHDIRFSVTRGGRLKFAQKVHCYQQQEMVEVLDEEGNPVPNPDYENDMARYGGTQEKPHKRERVVTDTPRVELSYHVDHHWWARNAVTRVRF